MPYFLNGKNNFGHMYIYTVIIFTTGLAFSTRVAALNDVYSVLAECSQVQQDLQKLPWERKSSFEASMHRLEDMLSAIAEGLDSDEDLWPTLARHTPLKHDLVGLDFRSDAICYQFGQLNTFFLRDYVAYFPHFFILYHYDHSCYLFCGISKWDLPHFSDFRALFICGL